MSKLMRPVTVYVGSPSLGDTWMVHVVRSLASALKRGVVKYRIKGVQHRVFCTATVWSDGKDRIGGTVSVPSKIGHDRIWGDVEDLIQGAYTAVVAASRKQGFDPNSPQMRPLVLGIAYFAVSQYLRGMGHVRPTSGEIDPNFSPKQDPTDPRDLGKMLALLDNDNDRTIVRLLSAGQSQTEIAATLSLTKGAVSNRITRMRERMLAAWQARAA